MIHRIIFLWVIQFAIVYFANAQINDDFSDGNLIDSPAWCGDTAKFIVNPEYQLQLSSPPESGFAYVSTISQVINEAEWSFYVRLKFNPSSRNYMDVYLVADDSILTNPLNGYFVRIGNTEDEISLYKQIGERSEASEIIDGRDDVVDKNSVELRIKVVKDAYKNWTLYVDDQLDGNFVLEGQAIDNDIFHSKFAGIVCTYTSTRSDKFFFDDLHIDGQVYTDNVKPWVDSLQVLSDSSIFINFSEKMQLSALLDVQNYEVDNEIGHPATVLLNENNGVILHFHGRFENEQPCHLTLSNLTDQFSNPLTNSNFVFAYFAPYIIQFGDILITEIMADPSPGVDLPEYEYLEIYNPTDDLLTVEGAKLIVGNDTAFIPDLEIKPKEYLIFCQSAAVEHLSRYGKTIRIPNWPSLNNRGERIIIVNLHDEVVYSVNYNDDWYKSISKDDGGWSLEMIDTGVPCRGKENWTASKDPNGGTPGVENSQAMQMLDLTAPSISSVIATSDSTLTIHLDENIGPTSSAQIQISIQPELGVRKTCLLSPDFSRLNVKLEDDIATSVIYELELSNLEDCSGNVIKSSKAKFVLPEPVASGDLIVNEILFNPPPGGIDFVEIYNNSDKFIDLKSILIGNESYHPASNEHFIINPKQHLAITENVVQLLDYYPTTRIENIIIVENLPSLNDDEGEVKIVNLDSNQIDRVRYSEDLHSSFLHDVEGVSLERISYDKPSEEPSNWQSAASTAGFATPGEINSQFYMGEHGFEAVQVDPKVFDPGNNGFYDFTLIKCRFPNSGNMASIRILNSRGMEVKSLISNKSISNEVDFKWDGLDNEGREVKMGPYIVSVEVYDASGHMKLYRKKVVVGTVF